MIGCWAGSLLGSRKYLLSRMSAASTVKATSTQLEEELDRVALNQWSAAVLVMSKILLTCCFVLIYELLEKAEGLVPIERLRLKMTEHDGHIPYPVLVFDELVVRRDLTPSERR